MTNELASPLTAFTTPRTPRVRTLFALDFPAENPVENGWISESYPTPLLTGHDADGRIAS